MTRFALAPLLPAALIAAACLWGGPWSSAALVMMTLWVAGLDGVLRPATGNDNADPVFGGRIALGLGALHFALLPLGVWALATRLHGPEAWLTGLALGLYLGQVSNSVAHELIHAPARGPRRLGVAIYCSLLFGHHASAHPKVHHVHVATDQDPNSAPLGVGFYRFWPRAWLGSFRAGLAAENRLRQGQRAPGVHPYLVYIGGAALALAVAGWIGGAKGLLIWTALAGYAQMQLILSDYVQHYGLRRARRADGRPEPAGLCHSWNAPHWYSSAMMLNAPRHSDHHARPARGFPDLVIDSDTMPVLPGGLPAMAALALVPPLWRRVMDPRARAWMQPPGETAPLATATLGSA